MPRSKKLQNEIDRLRKMKDEDIDYSDISDTSNDWLNAAELALEFTSDRPKEKISMLIDHEVLDFACNQESLHNAHRLCTNYSGTDAPYQSGTRALIERSYSELCTFIKKGFTPK